MNKNMMHVVENIIDKMAETGAAITNWRREKEVVIQYNT